MATLFRGDVRAWDIVEMDVAEARRGLALRLARSASLWAIGALVVAGLTIAGMDAAEAATGRTPAAGAAPVLALTAGLAAAFALVGMMARVTFQRRKRRA